MSIKRLTIKGLRGFSAKTNIHFAIPDNITPGSGLTVMVGPNNSGKSTVIEAEVIIGNVSTLQSTDGGAQNRENYKGNISNSDYRGENNINNNFGGRLLEIYNRRNVFDECLEKVISPLPNWTIESINSNNLYLEFSFDEVKHSSNGAGDGYINILILLMPYMILQKIM